jgi:hypothetical protein
MLWLRHVAERTSVGNGHLIDLTPSMQMGRRAVDAFLPRRNGSVPLATAFITHCLPARGLPAFG